MQKRIAVRGQGKSGATRALVTKESGHGIFFVAGRQKSDPGNDFTDANIAQAQIIGEALQKAYPKKLGVLIEDGVLTEICHGHPEK